MKRRIVLFFLLITLVLSTVNVRASVISDGIGELNLAADRYYNTNITYADMTIKRTKDHIYEIYYTHHNGKSLTLTFCLTEWGTWNLGDWKLKSSNATKIIVGGGTDWEYVFRVFNPLTQNLEFTGGNHGSEKLNTIRMYDAVTGEEFKLAKGQSKYVNRLVIEENTSIFFGDMEYMPYANVTRRYTVVGNRVNLDCKIEFVRDVKMALSYSAMASVNKDFGRYCMFDDGTYISTSPKGICMNAYYGHKDSMTVHLNGDDSNASLTMGIYNKNDMTDNFSNNDKTFIWDMTENFNKVYFSKKNITELSPVLTGTVWDFGTYWKINL